MNSPFYTTTNSIDEHSYNDREIYSIRDPNYIDQKEKIYLTYTQKHLLVKQKK